MRAQSAARVASRAGQKFVRLEEKVASVFAAAQTELKVRIRRNEVGSSLICHSNPFRHRAEMMQLKQHNGAARVEHLKVREVKSGRKVGGRNRI